MYQYPNVRKRPDRSAFTAGPWTRPTGLPTAVALVEESTSRQLSLATNEDFRSVPASSAGEAARVVRETSARVLLISPALLAREPKESVQLLLSRCPGTRPVIVLAEAQDPAPYQLLTLGAFGITEVVDLRVPADYARLRNLVTAPDADVTGKIMTNVMEALANAHPGVTRFFGVLIQAAPEMGTSRDLARLLRVRPSTLVSRFYRAGLPSPKTYLSQARILFAAAYLERRRHSIGDVAYKLQFSSPQSFGRHLRTVLGVTAGAYRKSVVFEHEILRFRTDMVTPYLSTFTSWNPLRD